MTILKSSSLTLLISFTLLFYIKPVYAATITSAQTGNWNTTSTWIGGVVPLSTDDVIISSSHNVTVNTTVTINDLTINSGGTLSIPGYSFTVNGITTVEGILTLITSASGTKTFTGLVTISSTGSWTNPINEGISFKGGLTVNGSLSSGTGAYAFITNSQSIGGSSSITISNISVTGVTLTNTGTLTLSSALSGTGGLTNNGTLNISFSSAPSITTLTASASGNTVNYNNSSSSTTQSIKLPASSTYHHLTLTGVRRKNFPSGATTINGNLTTSGTDTAYTYGTLTINGNLNIGTGTTFDARTYTDYVKGNFINDGSFVTTTGTMILNGTSAQNIGGVAQTSFKNLTINNTSSAVTASSNFTVTGILTLSSNRDAGDLAMGSYTLTMGSAATTTGAGDVTGIIKRTTIVANTAYSFGNLYSTITFPLTGTLPTEMSIKVTIGSAPSWKPGAIKRTYEIIQTGGSGALATVKLHYRDNEINGNTESELTCWHYHYSNSEIEEHGNSNRSATNNWIELANVGIETFAGSFGNFEWTLSNKTTGAKTWDGEFSTDWNNPSNWLGGIPASTDDVIIPQLLPGHLYEAILPSNDTVNRITIQPGGTLNGGTGTTLVLLGGNDTWLNQGTFNAGTSTIIFKSSTAGIAGETNFYNVTIASGADLTMTTGNIMRISGTMTNSGTWGCRFLYNTVEYNGANQTILNPNGGTGGYQNLILSGSGTKTIPSTALTIAVDFSTSGTVNITAASAWTAFGNFTIGSGTTFNAGSYNHIIGKNLTVNGSFSPSSSTINLNGTEQQNVSSTSVFNLIINNNSGIVLNSNLNVANSLTLTSGYIQTGSNIITLGTSTSSRGSLTYTSGTIIGNFKRWFDASTVSNILFPVGTNIYYRPANISFTSAPTTGGTIIASFNETNPGINGIPFIDGGVEIINVAPEGFWTLTAGDGLTAGTYSLDLTADGFIGVEDYTTLRIIKRTDSGSNWIVSGTHSAGTGSNTTPVIHRTGMTGFSDFAIGGATDNPLPVVLTYFNSSVNKRDIILTWETSFEINNSGFEILRKKNNEMWQSLGFIQGAGTSNIPKVYSFLDSKLNTGEYRYKLKQIDYNGHNESFILPNSVLISKPGNFSLSQNYPNPSNPKSKIEYEIPFDAKVTIKVYDVIGREVTTLINGNKEAGFHIAEFDGVNLASGSYFYRITADGLNGEKFSRTMKLILVK